MNYIATIDEKEVKVSVREVGVARYAVLIDGEEHQVDAHQVQHSVWSVLYGDASFEVDVQGKEEEFEARRKALVRVRPSRIVKVGKPDS